MDFWAADAATLVTIAGMALVTWCTRMSGYLFGRRLQIAGRTKAALEAMPPAILTAIIAPLVLTEGPAEAIAATVTVLAALRLPTLAAISLGVGAVVVLRHIGL